MNIVGGKWTFLIMGELSNGPKGFNEMCRSLNISTKSLTDTLKKLEVNQIIIRDVKQTSPITVRYSLTEKGIDFQSIFLAMRNWGIKWL